MPELSQTGAFPFICEGGLVANRSTFIMKPGQAIQLENFEPDIEGGYRRINGYSRHIRQIVPHTSSSAESVLMIATFANKTLAAVKATPTATCPRKVKAPPLYKARAPAPGPANISGTKP